MVWEFMIYIFSYLLGSINFSWILGKALKVDISKTGDENLGSMNLYFSLKEKHKHKAIYLAIFGGLMDALKAYIPTILFGPLAGAFAVLGHCFSIFSIIITKKVPTGIGMASSIGWLLGLGIKITIEMLGIIVPLLILGVILFYDIIEIDNLNIYTIFLVLTSVLLYIFIFDPETNIKISMILIAIITSFSATLRSKIVIKKLITK